MTKKHLSTERPTVLQLLWAVLCGEVNRLHKIMKSESYSEHIFSQWRLLQPVIFNQSISKQSTLTVNHYVYETGRFTFQNWTTTHKINTCNSSRLVLSCCGIINQSELFSKSKTIPKKSQAHATFHWSTCTSKFHGRSKHKILHTKMKQKHKRLSALK